MGWIAARWGVHDVAAVLLPVRDVGANIMAWTHAHTAHVSGIRFSRDAVVVAGDRPPCTDEVRGDCVPFVGGWLLPSVGSV